MHNYVNLILVYVHPTTLINIFQCFNKYTTKKQWYSILAYFQLAEHNYILWNVIIANRQWTSTKEIRLNNKQALQHPCQSDLIQDLISYNFEKHYSAKNITTITVFVANIVSDMELTISTTVQANFKYTCLKFK